MVVEEHPRHPRAWLTPAMIEYEAAHGRPLEDLIWEAYRDANGRQAPAARTLGIAPGTLSRWLDRLYLRWDIMLWAEEECGVVYSNPDYLPRSLHEDNYAEAHLYESLRYGGA